MSQPEHSSDQEGGFPTPPSNASPIQELQAFASADELVDKVQNNLDISPTSFNFLKTIIINFLKTIGVGYTAAISIALSIISILTLIFTSCAKYTRIVNIVSHIVNIITTLGLYLNVASDDIDQLATQIEQDFGTYDDDKILSHYEKIANMMTKQEVYDYIDKNDLRYKLKLPDVSYYELKNDVLSKNKLLHLWIFNKFNDRFLSMWYGVAEHRIYHLRDYMHFERQGFIPENLFDETRKIINLGLSVIFSFVGSKIMDEPFKKADINNAIRNTSQITSPLDSVWTCLKKLLCDNSAEERFQNEILEYTTKFDQFLGYPHFKFAKNHKLVNSISKDLDSCAKFIRNCPQNKQSDIFPLQGLYTATVKRRNEILTNVMPKFARQEPFVVLFQGPGAIGKTHLVQDLANRCVNEFFDEPVDDYIEISPDDKYWPPLSGQRVAFFDEAGNLNDLTEDLLFRNIKSICSPAYFNCAAADVEHKISPCPFELVFATVNSDLDELQCKLASTFGQASVYPIWRRCIVLKCEWDESVGGQFNHKDPQGHQPDYSHLKMELFSYDNTTSRLQKDHNINYAQLYDMIRLRFRKKQQDHDRKISLLNVERQSCRQHFSVAFFGETGQGKTYGLANIVKTLQRATGLPISKFDKPAIHVFDDFIKDKDDPNTAIFMDFYNKKAMDGSILINTLNVYPKIMFQPIFFLAHLIFRFSQPFIQEGVYRRIGYNGYTSHSNNDLNCPIFVKDHKYYEYKQKVYLYASFDFIKLILQIIFFPITYMMGWQIGLELVEIKDVNRYIYDKYSVFLSARRDIEVVRGNPKLDNVSLDFRFAMQKFHRVSFNNPYELDKYIHFDENKYDSIQNYDWKMYLSDRVKCRLATSYDKFFITIDEISLDSILSELKRYVLLFKQYGITPNMELHLGEHGSFYHIDNKIYYPETNLQNSINLPEVFTDGKVIYLRDLRIPVSDMFDDLNINDKFNLGFEDSLALGSFRNSDEFIQNPLVRKALVNAQYNKLSAKIQCNIKQTKDKVYSWVQTPIGRLCSIGIFILVSSLTALTLYSKFSKYFKKDKSQKRKSYRLRKQELYKEDHQWFDDDSSDFEEQRKGERKTHSPKYIPSDRAKLQRKGERKTHSPKYIPSDRAKLQDQRRGEKKVAKVPTKWTDGVVKTQDFDPDDFSLPVYTTNDKGNLDVVYNTKNEEPTHIVLREEIKKRKVTRALKRSEKQDVMKLPDVNGFDGGKPYFEIAEQKARKNLVQLYVVLSDEDSLEEIPADRVACYGLFLFNKRMITIGHAVDTLHQNPQHNLYVGCDSFDGKYYKANLLQHMKRRDISLWEVKCPQEFPDLTNLFIPRSQLYEFESCNTMMCRFGQNKKEIYLFGTCEFVEAFYKIDSKGAQEFGYIDWATHDITLTSGGDCGLPYYVCERSQHQNKILGIHFAGNVPGHQTIGLSALVYKEDLIQWKSYTKQQKCEFCDLQSLQIKKATHSRYDIKNHEIVWNNMHDSSPASYLEELNYYLDCFPRFNGLIKKSSGEILYGSIEHSHTHFISNCYEKLTVTNGWQLSTAGELNFETHHIDPNLEILYRVVDVEFKAIFRVFSSQPYAKNFRLYINVYTKNQKPRATVLLAIPVSDFNAVPKTDRQVMSPLRLTMDEEVYVTEDIKDIFDTAIKRKQRGILPDIPYETVENETVEVIGITHRNMTPFPTQMYKPTPFYSHCLKYDLEHKLPVNFDMTQCPDDQKKLMVRDRLGNYNPRVTQGLKWAHKDYAPNYDLRKYCKQQYMSNIMEYYAGMNLLTDDQVLRGYPLNHRLYGSLGGLEIDSSIGWTMKELYRVTKKSDVINLSPDGSYQYLDNEASEFTQELYQASKLQASKGERYYTAFNELIKMEKLKPSKNFLPRTFTANDLNGVLMERYILGEFTARAMAWDENVAVGCSAYSTFNKFATKFFQFKNFFSCDYKNFDRTIPVCVFDDICDMLVLANPHMENELRSCFKTITRRIQVTGNHITLITGGMPSGCIPTAPLNSKCNDLIIYTCYVDLMRKADRGDITSYRNYQLLTRRLYYGDDVIISVDDSIAEVFNCRTLADSILENFGMIVTDGSKSDVIPKFENLETLSFISRFFRVLDYQENFTIGALKKISIQTHFYYTTDSTPEHFGQVFETIQLEAALWDEDYFNKIQSYMRHCVRLMPRITHYFNFKTYRSIQKDIVQKGWVDFVRFEEVDDNLVKCEKPSKVTGTQRKVNKDREKFLRFLENPKNEKFALTGEFPKKKHRDFYLEMSKSMRLNELFQKGSITKPFITFNYEFVTTTWYCDISCKRVDKQIEIKANGKGSNKALAREMASEQAIAQICDQPNSEVVRQLNDPFSNCDCCHRAFHLSSFLRGNEQLGEYIMTNQGPKFIRKPLNIERQMNVSKASEQQVPSAPMQALDPSVAPDSGIATNTITPSISRVLNPIAAALNNPAGSGAPFDKHTYCYNVFTRWPEKSTVVNKSLAAGAEVFRISLNPMELPKRLSQYIAFHKALIPQIEIQILIGGAAGTVGWLKIGWVPDCDKSKKYTLDDLQTVASETINLNSTITLSTIINDNRKSGLYRSLSGDSEPWPGIICMVEHPITNVQRNDDVNYPVIISVRLGPDCCLMQPYNELDFPVPTQIPVPIQVQTPNQGSEN